MRKVLLTTLAVAAMSVASASAVSAGEVLSPYQMQEFLKKDQEARQAVMTARPAPRRSAVRYEPGTTGAIAVPQGSYAYGPGPDVWPACPYGPPACTAAGYPNLRYQREMLGGY